GGVTATGLIPQPDYEFDVVCKFISHSRKIKYSSEGRIKERVNMPFRVASFEETKLKVYPNPFSDKLTFNISGEVGAKLKVELFDIEGKEISIVDGENMKDEKVEVNFNCEN